MKREIIVDGKTFQIEINECPIGEPFKLNVNNKQREVALEQEPESAKSFTIRIDRKSYQVELLPGSVKVNNIPFKAELKTTALTSIAIPAAVSQVQLSTTRASRSMVEGAVVAPMAGKIVSIKVKRGDSVKAGAILCTLEAMKMENEIASPRNGVVEQIMVQEGKGVNEGDALMIVK